MTRRWFISVALALLMPIGWIAPKRWCEALRTRVYPGPVRPLDEAVMKTPAKWVG